MKEITRRDFLKASGLTLFSLALSGCLPQSLAANSPNTPRPNTPEGKITIWGWEPEDLGVKALIPGFQKKYPKVEVEFVVVPWDSLHTKLLAAIQAGSGGPDLSLVEGYFMPQFQDGAVDLTDIITPYRNQISAAKLKEIEANGRIFGFPGDCPSVALIYRSDIFEKVGLTKNLPTKWDEFLKVVGEKVNIPEKQSLFGMDGDNSPGFYWWRPLAAQLGSGYFDKNGKVIIDSPEAIRVTQWMYDAVVTYGYTAKGIGYWEEPSWWSALKDNRVVASIAAPWQISLLKQQVPEQSGKWKAIPMPVFDDSNFKSGLLGGSSYIIPKTSTNQELAVLFGEYAYLTVEGNLSRLNSIGHWPSLLPTFDDSSFSAEDPYFGGQKINALYGELAKDNGGNYYTKNFSEADSKSFRPHIHKIFAGEETVEGGMKAAANEMRALS